MDSARGFRLGAGAAGGTLRLLLVDIGLPFCRGIFDGCGFGRHSITDVCVAYSGQERNFLREEILNVQIIALVYSIGLIRLAFTGVNRHDYARRFCRLSTGVRE
jgi:hypothetical protein